MVSPLAGGHPGTLPVPNKMVVEDAVLLGLALNCSIEKYNEYARKNYFYADLPKGYQITQDKTPICYKGYIEVEGAHNQTVSIGITRIHMEEDTGKSIHDIDPHHSLIDLNRSGVPLLEIVTEPDFRDVEAVYNYLTTLKKIIQFLEISDVNMEEGSLRCDANISVRKQGESAFRNRVEVKNLNSFRQVQKAILYEQQRQIDSYEQGKTVEQETRNYDPKTDTTIVLRNKENAHDYRYFPEPDISPIVLEESWIESIRDTMPRMPQEWMQIFRETYGLSDYDATILLESRPFAEFFHTVCTHTKHYKTACNYMTGFVKSCLNEQAWSIEEFPLSPKQLADVVNLIEEGKINHNSAQEILLPKLLKNTEDDVEALADKYHLLQSQDSQEMTQWIETAIASMPEEYARLKSGEQKLMGVFIGKIRQLSKGKADPKQISILLKTYL